MSQKGDLFGTTVGGGRLCPGQDIHSLGCGTVFKLTIK